MSDIKAITTFGILLGAVLTAFRKKKGMTQAELAEMAGFSQSTWSRIEHGEHALTVEQLNFVAGTLATTGSEILKITESIEKEASNGGVTVNPKGSSKSILEGAVSAAVEEAVPGLTEIQKASVLPLVGAAVAVSFIGGLIAKMVDSTHDK